MLIIDRKALLLSCYGLQVAQVTEGRDLLAQ